jgi:hypothetical protein
MTDDEFSILLALLNDHWADTRCWRIVATGLNAFERSVGRSGSGTNGRRNKRFQPSQLTQLVSRVVSWLGRQTFAYKIII